MEIDEIINQYKDKFGMITNIDKLINDLKKIYTDIETYYILKEIILYNKDKMKKINNFIDSFNNTEKQVHHNISQGIYEDNPQSIKTGIDTDISAYLNMIDKSCNESDLIIILNSFNDDNIIELIKCKLLEYIVLYKKEIIEDPTNKDYYQNEINNLNYKLEYIINYQKIISDDTKKSVNKILLLDEHLIFEDLAELDPSQYSSYHSMLTSIIIGTFVRQRSVFLTKGYKLSEIRNINGNRIVYIKIADEYYCIISLFDKNNGFTFRQKVFNRIGLLSDRINELKKQINDNSVDLEPQDKLLSLLSSKKRGLHG